MVSHTTENVQATRVGITDEELAKELCVLNQWMRGKTPDQGWALIHPSSRDWYIDMARRVRELLAPRYADADADVGRLIHEASHIVRALDSGHRVDPKTGFHVLTKEALERLTPPRPTPEQLRMERGEAAWEATKAPNRWESLNGDTQEAYCRIADAVLARKTEQDAEGRS